MRRISTTNRPDKQIEVTDAEYLDLARQGLIHEEHDQAERRTRKQSAPASNDEGTA